MVADRGRPPRSIIFKYFNGKSEESVAPTLVGGGTFLKNNAFYRNLECKRESDIAHIHERKQGSNLDDGKFTDRQSAGDLFEFVPL